MALWEQLQYFFVILAPVVLAKSYGLYLDYSENIEYVQPQEGYNILLQCDIKGLVNGGNVEGTKIYWYFKQCREKTVDGDRHHDWLQLPCEENFCKSDLLLRNVTEEYSGLYKCAVIPLEPRSDKVHARLFQLEVRNKSMVVPKFIEPHPLNKSASTGEQAVFHCRVQSEEHPTIKWFRRLTTTNSVGLVYTGRIGKSGVNPKPNFQTINYNGNTYELLYTALEKYIGDDIYLSKLILNGVRRQDEGFYACAAINFHGYNISEAYLKVDNKKIVEYWTDYNNNGAAYTDRREFWILFLMPLGLAMFPLVVWLSYLAYKRRLARSEAKKKSPTYSDELSEGDRCVLRT
ncbi:fibroblast growth factor receptor 3 isoform X2 [Rhagoletis pomonella]|uniref:fibroblast growth factor receptor 3 isoform X2 n=1 Tax=Rhagoletis pomonella TaxID=28610 RepID=UPI0017868B2E|nr:fibroblast growth factor receptor 3 isoform X2 [Rhagoletis pomonella]